MTLGRLSCLLLLATAHGCGLVLEPDLRTSDSGATIGVDATLPDGSLRDGARPDSTRMDGTVADASTSDGSVGDTGVTDTMRTDASPPTTSSCVVGTRCRRADGVAGLCDEAGRCADVGCEVAICQIGCAFGRVDCSTGVPKCVSEGSLAPAGAPCRGSIDSRCDVTETCTGTSTDCPPDIHSSDGDNCSTCGDGLYACRRGRCQPATSMPAQGDCPMGQFCCGNRCDSLVCF